MKKSGEWSIDLLTRKPFEPDRVYDPEEPGLTPTGLPRPLDTYDGKLLPVPWNQSTDWGAIEQIREAKARLHSLCQVCGLTVEDGMVVVHPEPNQPVKDAYTFEDIAKSIILDNAPLHDRCAKLSMAHCPELRDDPYKRGYVLRPYSYQCSSCPDVN